MPEDLLMNSNELKHNEVPETHQNGERVVAPQDGPPSPPVEERVGERKPF